MTDAAPERITLARKLGSDEWATMPKGHTMSMGYLDAEQYAPEAELATAQARIAELEAALEEIEMRTATGEGLDPQETGHVHMLAGVGRSIPIKREAGDV